MVSRSVASVCLVALLATLAISADAAFCKAGTGIDRLGNCQKCGPASVSPKGGNNVACTKCADGKTANDARTRCVACPYNQYGVDGLCKICPKGTYRNGVGATNVSSCLPCTAVTGYGVMAPLATCSTSFLVCSPDYPPITRFCGPNRCWSNALQCCTNKATPNKCASPKLEARCAAGRGLDEDRRCKLCAPGFYNNGKPPMPFRCKPCPAGTEPSAAGDKCVPCKVGQYSLGGTKCRGCGRGAYSQPGSNKCIKCRTPTFVLRKNGTCRDYIICLPNQVSKIGLCPVNFCFKPKRGCVKNP